jgi:hypothetical protein
MGRSLEHTKLWAIELGRYYSGLLEILEGESTIPSSTVGVSGTVTGIRLLVVLRAVKVSGYRSRLTGSGLSRGVQNRPANRGHCSVYTQAHNAVCPDEGNS